MEFCQSGNVGTLGYCGIDIFLIRWNFYVNIDPKVIGGHIKNNQKIYLEFFLKNLEKSWKFHGFLSVWKCGNTAPWLPSEIFRSVFSLRNEQLIFLHLYQIWKVNLMISRASSKNLASQKGDKKISKLMHGHLKIKIWKCDVLSIEWGFWRWKWSTGELCDYFICWKRSFCFNRKCTLRVSVHPWCVRCDTASTVTTEI